ncbi:glycosyltransferase family 4 protein [uncultured Methanobacterium sp.]|uniref:glycosyltransferase family 4 protein n=1 Tax=uncultured Methanobacterium sp. TaxID=176306 RepID=UPI002AA74209|nr:glycosyltransferase family 4 protein [uncultured Methanobacterium sp.]
MSEDSATRILFIHNTIMWYRIPLFRALSDIYTVNYLFNHPDISQTLYGVETQGEIDGMEGVNYTLLTNHLGVAWGLTGAVWGDYQVLVGGSWDSIPEIMESIYCFSVAWLRRKPVILWREDWGWEDESLKSRLLKPFIKWMVQTASAIVVPGTRHREYFIDLGAKPEKTFIMPNVSNQTVQKQEPEDITQLEGMEDLSGKRVVLYVGRLIERKGIKYLIQAIKKSKTEDAVLLIVGGGEYEDELKSMVRELGLETQVIFTGNVSQDKLVSYYLLSDLVVIPSITLGIGDPWVLVLNEAMYYKKPVVATDAVGAASDMILEGENGFTVPEKDARALQVAIDRILENDDLRSKMGQRSFQIIQEGFCYPNMVEGFQKAVNYVLGK